MSTQSHKGITNMREEHKEMKKVSVNGEKMGVKKE